MSFDKWLGWMGIDASVAEQLAGKSIIGTNGVYYDVPRGNQYFGTLIEVGKIFNIFGIGVAAATTALDSYEVLHDAMPVWQYRLNILITGASMANPVMAVGGAAYFIGSTYYPGGRQAYNVEFSRVLNVTEGGGR